MAQGFGATYGTGAADLVTSTYTGISTGTETLVVRAYRNGTGGGGFGRISQKTGSHQWRVSDASNFGLTRNWSGSVGTEAIWSWPITTTGSWKAIGFSYDTGSTSNVPVAYEDLTKPTVTTVQAAVGTVGTLGAAAWTVGNRPAGETSNRNWDGMLAEYAIWDVILTDNEFFAYAMGMSPLLIRPASLQEYIPMVRSAISYVVAAPTFSATVTQPHPKIIMPRSKQQRYKATAAAAAGRIFKLAGYGGGLVGPQIGLAG